MTVFYKDRLKRIREKGTLAENEFFASFPSLDRLRRDCSDGSTGAPYLAGPREPATWMWHGGSWSERLAACTHGITATTGPNGAGAVGGEARDGGVTRPYHACSNLSADKYLHAWEGATHGECHRQLARRRRAVPNEFIIIVTVVFMRTDFVIRPPRPPHGQRYFMF